MRSKTESERTIRAAATVCGSKAKPAVRLRNCWACVLIAIETVCSFG
ncbi:UNVERIFIED_CONTAM: hypothetical protein GTU68_001578 [Idotea baltica]|nr:hypothetical protein [Idotea baltica]